LATLCHCNLQKKLEDLRSTYCRLICFGHLHVVHQQYLPNLPHTYGQPWATHMWLPLVTHTCSLPLATHVWLPLATHMWPALYHTHMASLLMCQPPAQHVASLLLHTCGQPFPTHVANLLLHTCGQSLATQMWLASCNTNVASLGLPLATHIWPASCHAHVASPCYIHVAMFLPHTCDQPAPCYTHEPAFCCTRGRPFATQM
jgi:hypothetical protein